ncbi:MAG: hypothetical protein ACNYVW_05245 [Methanosarcinales archaeon]
MTYDEMWDWLAKGASALSLSAQKWRDIQEELAERMELNAPATTFRHYCALCALNKGEWCTDWCTDCCIIGKRISKGSCLTTPYIAFRQACIDGDMQAMIEAANAELAFLEYLDGNVNYLWYIEEEEVEDEGTHLGG